MRQKVPQTKNTLDWRLALPGPLLTMYGVEYAMAQLRSQLDAVVIERHLARTFSGKSSPVTTHATGPLQGISMYIASVQRRKDRSLTNC